MRKSYKSLLKIEKNEIKMNKTKMYFARFSYTDSNGDLIEDSSIIELSYTDLNDNAIKRKIVHMNSLDEKAIGYDEIKLLIVTLL